MKKLYKETDTGYIIPAFLDTHTHGGYGQDTMDGAEALNIYLEGLSKEGVGGIFATTITSPMDEVRKTLEENESISDQYDTKFLGYHIEGNFLSAEKRGAHNDELFKRLTFEEMKELQEKANGKIRTLTFAPEMTTVEDIQKIEKELNIKPQMGHTNATKELFDKFVKETNVRVVTHMYNAMSALSHREPGVVGGTLMSKDVNLEMIVDGVHICPDIVKFTYDLVGVDRIFGITDSIRPKGLADGESNSAGMVVIKKGLTIRTDRGEIAGGGASMIDIFKNLMKFTGCSIEDAVKMTSTNAAKYYGLDNKYGYVEDGYIQIELDKDFNFVKFVK